MRALITGVGGFVGRHLARRLAGEGLEVWGIDRGKGGPEQPAVDGVRRVVHADLMDRDQTRRAIGEAAPDLVFHLAAQAAPAVAWKDPHATLHNNVFAQLGLLEALRDAGSAARIVVASSGEVYGAPAGPDELPVKETNPLRPTNPYALSKAAQDLMGYQYFSSYGMAIVRARPFNHLGPGQSADFVAPAFAQQVVEAEQGLREPVVRVGNLEAMRDFTDVRDVVRAYHLLALQGEPGEVYNIGSGAAVSVQSLLDFFLAHARVAIRVERDPERDRPVDVPCVYADTAKLRQATGWEPSVPIEETLSDVLEYWRARLQRPSPAGSGHGPHPYEPSP